MLKRSAAAEDLPPSWEKLKRATEEAKSWLDLIYLVESPRNTTVNEIETQIAELRAQAGSEKMMIVIDDCQRLGNAEQALDTRLPIIAEQLQQTAMSLNVPLLAVWLNLDASGSTSAQAWSEKVASPHVILVLEKDVERSKKLTEPNQAVMLHIVKNRSGEKGKLAFDFSPTFSKFTEVQ
jgi:replicative DNA helicase